MVTDVCTTDFNDFVITSSITGTITENGGNLMNGRILNIGTYHITYTVTDEAGQFATHSFDVVVKQSPAAISMSHSVVSGGGSGTTPKQCGEYRYYVTSDAAAPEAGHTYTWNVYAGSGTGGTLLTAGSDYLIDASNPYHAASVKISWQGSLTPGTYTIEVIKASNGCDSRTTLVVSLENSFNLSVEDPGEDCKGESLGSKTINWEINRTCGTSNYTFSYIIAAGDYNTLIDAQAHVALGPFTITNTTDNPKVILQNVDYGSTLNFYTTQVFTLFIYNISDGNSQPDLNSGDNFGKFFLKGIPNTSVITTD
jgi:hypothetical protein